MDTRTWNKDFFTEFIEAYRALPVLWKVKSKEYSNRDKKNSAYEQLLTKLREVDPNATIDEVKKKINSIRTSWRKEYKKVMCSKKSGTGTEDVYEPHLWYYYLLLFLEDQETPRPSTSNVGNDTILEVTEVADSDFEGISEDGNSSEANGSTTIDCSCPPSTGSKRKRQQKGSQQDSHEEILQLIGSQTRNQAAASVPDRFEHLGKNVASKLRDMKRDDQRNIAEKLIADVLFQAEFGNLTQKSQIQLTPPVFLPYNSPSHPPEENDENTLRTQPVSSICTPNQLTFITSGQTNGNSLSDYFITFNE